MKLASQQTQRFKPHWLPLVTQGGILLYLVLVVTLHVLRPDYTPLFHAESDFAVGPFSFLMTIAFVVRGLLSLALLPVLWPLAASTSMRRHPGLLSLTLWGIGSLLLACFPTDLEGTTHHTLHGGLHLLLAVIAFTGMLVATFRLPRLFERDWRATLSGRGLSIIAWLMLIAFVTMFTAIGIEMGQHSSGYFGLFERIFIGLSLLWLWLVAHHLRKTSA
ncbi:membrane protein [Dictyobacter alpinus]|uniref:Membrane protein n=1 Tax=Dictyobacter alpinus TaxID=2014873 RepID=A0A402BEA5_9CHLR|nr:DUF998 domain-containing protein [Dictyobacter alpinus]GCE29630.1 membrane protein [Dictyobacter alpinus]